MIKNLALFFCVCFTFSIRMMAQPADSINKKLSFSIQALLSGKKISIRQNDSIDFIMAVKTINAVSSSASVRLMYRYDPSQTVWVRTALRNLNQLILDDNLVFIDLLRVPKEEITTGAFDLTSNRINTVQKNYPLYNGSNILVSVKEHLFDTTDIDFKGRWINTGVASGTVSTHASIIATMIGGGANTSPYAKGVAIASKLTSSSFTSLLPDADEVYRQYKISVQNHSYGVGIENFYGADASSYDKSVNNNPSLVHVFSAGNIGTNTSTAGFYQGIPAYANLSGSFKMAKNIITVGATDSLNNVLLPSSRGPAYDGRVKPELVAFGEDGSSGAAALVSGTVALLQNIYRDDHQGSLPPAALIKSILINSADDIGAKKIDYKSGYGKLNAYRAVTTLDDNRFFTAAIQDGETKTFTLNVPPNTAQFKITLVWSDTAAAPNASKALVNDIDLVIKNTSNGQTWLPWVLNIAAHSDSLQKLAERKIDTLNNVEQVSIDLPLAGLYTVEIRGTHIQTTTQEFAISYQADSIHSFQWTYPAKHDDLLAGNRTVLRWDTNISGGATLEYSYDGTQWQTISQNTDLSKGHFIWDTPFMDTVALLRMIPDNPVTAFTSDSFIISRPLNIRVGFNCSDSFLLYWNSIDRNYLMYQLGAFYMEPFTMTPDTFRVLNKNQHPQLHYAVSPVIKNITGRRSYTINYQDQGVNCYFTNFLAQLQDNNGWLSTQLGSLYNVNKVSFMRLSASGYHTIGSLSPSSTSLLFIDSFLKKGVNTYQAVILLNNGTVVYSEPVSIYYFPDRHVIFYPNPAKHNQPINIITSDFDVYTIHVFDTNGRLIYQRRLEENYQTIPPLRLPRGLYLVKVVDDENNVFTEKIVVN